MYSSPPTSVNKDASPTPPPRPPPTPAEKLEDFASSVDASVGKIDERWNALYDIARALPTEQRDAIWRELDLMNRDIQDVTGALDEFLERDQSRVYMG